MTVAAKRNLKLYMPYLSFLPVFYMVFAWGQFTENASSRMFEDAHEKESVIHHVEDNDLHMPYSKKVKEFVPRNEVDGIKEDIREIKKDVKSLLKNSK